MSLVSIGESPNPAVSHAVPPAACWSSGTRGYHRRLMDARPDDDHLDSQDDEVGSAEGDPEDPSGGQDVVEVDPGAADTNASPDADLDPDDGQAEREAWEDWGEEDWATYHRRRRRLLVVAGAVLGLGVVVALVGILAAIRDDGGDTATDAAGTDGVPTDDFNRRTSFSEVGVAANGDSWSPVAGVWGIDAAQVFLVEPSLDGSRNLLVLDVGSPDGELAVVFARVRKGAGLLFRYESPQDYWILAPSPDFGTWAVQRWVDGELDFNENIGLAHSDDGTRAFVRLDGPTLEVQIDDLEPVTFDIGASDATGAGFSALGEGVSQARWDDFFALPR